MTNSNLPSSSLLANVPQAVQTRVRVAADRVKNWNDRVSRARETDALFQGGGRYTWEATNGQQLQEPETITVFRELATGKGLNPDAILQALGYEAPTALQDSELNW